MMNQKKQSKNDQVSSFMTFDEYGRPFLILREQTDREQISGLEVIKVSLSNKSIVSSLNEWKNQN